MPEVLAQLVERLYVQQAGVARGLLELVGQDASQRGVETHEQRPEAFAREPPRLLRGEHRLASARAADDRRAPLPSQQVQDLELSRGQSNDVGLALDEFVSQTST